MNCETRLREMRISGLSCGKRVVVLMKFWEKFHVKTMESSMTQYIRGVGEKCIIDIQTMKNAFYPARKMRCIPFIYMIPFNC